MKHLPWGSYLIVNPKFYLPPLEYEYLKHTVDRVKLTTNEDWGISYHSAFVEGRNFKPFGWFHVGNSLYKDQFGHLYETHSVLCCIPIEIIDEDISMEEPFYFAEDFNVNFSNDIIFIDHLQLVKVI